MKLISWNVQRGGRPSRQVPRLAKRRPDLVALQEVTRATASEWTEQLRSECGLAHIETSHDVIGERTYCNLVASRWPLARLATKLFDLPHPERHLAVVVEHEGGELELHNTHVPDGSGHGWRKVEHFEGLYRYLSRTWRASGHPRVLCGDFNSPRVELDEDRIYTWAQNEDGKLMRDRGQRWDAAERSVILGLRAFDLTDVYRELHGYGREARAVSWATMRNGREFGRRFDHVFAARSLEPWTARYLEAWRSERLSDHAAIEVTFSGV